MPKAAQVSRRRPSPVACKGRRAPEIKRGVCGPETLSSVCIISTCVTVLGGCRCDLTPVNAKAFVSSVSSSSVAIHS